MNTGHFVKSAAESVQKHGRKVVAGGGAITVGFMLWVTQHVTRLETQIENMRGDVDFNTTNSLVMQDDYNDQIHELRTKFWTSNRVWRTEIEELKRKANNE